MGRTVSDVTAEAGMDRAALLQAAAIREIGKRAQQFRQEHPEDYSRIYQRLFGRLPEEGGGALGKAEK